MKIWKIIIIIVFFIVILLLYKKKEESNRIPFIIINTDSLYKEIDILKLKEDSLLYQINELSKNKQKVIIRYYEKDNSISILNADNSIMLFGQWNRQLQDSSYQERYFRIGTDSIYSQFK